MVEIGMPVKVIRPYKNGETREERIRMKNAIIVGIYKNFILVQFEKGYKECCRINELWYNHKEGEEYYGYKDTNENQSFIN